MGSLLVWTMFGERVVGILVWQRGKRSSENGFQTTFGLAGKGSSLERPRACVRTTHTLQTGFVGLQVGCVPKGTHAVAGYGLLCQRGFRIQRKGFRRLGGRFWGAWTTLFVRIF